MNNEALNARFGIIPTKRNFNEYVREEKITRAKFSKFIVNQDLVGPFHEYHKSQQARPKSSYQLTLYQIFGKIYREHSGRNKMDEIANEWQKFKQTPSYDYCKETTDAAEEQVIIKNYLESCEEHGRHEIPIVDNNNMDDQIDAISRKFRTARISEPSEPIEEALQNDALSQRFGLSNTPRQSAAAGHSSGSGSNNIRKAQRNLVKLGNNRARK